MFQDLRFGARMLLKKPGFTLIAVFTLALGIGGNTAIFSVVNAVLIRPLPYAQAERLVVLRQQTSQANAGDWRFSAPEWLDYRQQNQSFAGIEEYHNEAFVLFGLAEPLRVQAGVVSAGYFDLLGLPPALGRGFLPADDEPGSDPTLLLSYDFWQRQFGGDHSVVGRTFQLSGASHGQGRVYTVVGVLPPALAFPASDDVYMPTAGSPFSSAATRTDRRARRLQLVGRLKPGITAEQAQTDLSTISERLQQTYPEAYPQAGVRVSLSPLKEEVTKQAQPALFILLLTVALVLLLACANVANLALARLLKREKELAIRAAVGASRARLLRQLLTENLLLALLGGAIALLIASWSMNALTAFVARMTPRAAEIRLDGDALLFALVVTLIAGILVGAFPALQSRPELAAALNESYKTPRGVEKRLLRSALVVAQVAISIVLLIGTGLLARSLINLYRVDAGFAAENVLTARVTLNPSKFDDEKQQVSFFTAALEKINAHPEVVASAVTASVPLAQSRAAHRSFLIENRRAEAGRPKPAADLYVASPGYFKTLGAPLAQGRTFDERDQSTAPGVAVINRAMARYYWGDEDPVGSRVSLDEGESWLTVVGVVGDVRQLGLDREAAHQIFRPYAQFPVGNLILVRVRANPLNVSRHLQTAIRMVDPQLPVDQIRTLSQIRSDSIASPRLTAMLLGLFSALALAISVAGIGSVTALTSDERTREIGIRLALGAERSDILRLVIGQGMPPVLLGVVVGVAGAWALTRWLKGLLFGVSDTDPLTFVAVAVSLSVVALIACYLPARRAAKVDPLVALRAE